MLKIAEGIDLKELEKYGLKYKHLSCDIYNHWEYMEVDKETKQINTTLYIFESDRRIVNIDADDTLYDLIQAGIVVKE